MTPNQAVYGRMRSHYRALVWLAVSGFIACSADTTPNAPNIETFSASANRVAPGGTVTVRWKVSAATTVSIVASPGGLLVDNSTNLEGSATSAAIDAETTFTLTAKGEGLFAEQTLIVGVDATALGVSSFTADPNPGLIGGTTTLSWATTGANRIRVLRGADEVLSSDTMVTAGSVDVMLSQMSTAFTLEATDGTQTVTRDLTVTAMSTQQPPQITTFTVSPQSIRSRTATISVTWETRNSATVALMANNVAVPMFPGTPAGNFVATVDGDTVFELVVTNAVNTVRASASVAVISGGELEPNNDPTEATAIGPGSITGAIDSIGDIDYFSFDVAAGGNVFLEISDGQGGCNFASSVVLFDADQVTALVSDSDSGQSAAGGGACGKIDPQQYGAASDLPAGKYYAAVVPDTTPGAYSLTLIVGRPGCGNGLTELAAAEQCDDGNMMSGDGCSATCRFEGAGEVEPNDSFMQATAVGNATTIRGSLATTLDRDIFSINVPAGQSIEAFLTAPGLTSCQNNVFMEMALLGTDGTTERVRVFGAGPATDCSRVDPNSHVEATGLPGGTYFIEVASFDVPASGLNYFLHIRTIAPACGNGFVEGMEICDDGNVVSGDGCSSMCAIEVAGNVSPPGGTVSVSLQGSFTFQTIEVQITTAGQSLSAIASDGAGGCPVDTALIFAGTGLATRVFKSGGGPGACGAIVPIEDSGAADLAVGQYFLVVLNEGGTAGTVQVAVTISDPQCPNGITETRGGEACDDNNMVDGDGCGPGCQYDSTITQESEPNETRAQADVIPVVRNSVATAGGGLATQMDVDYYSFVIPPGPPVRMSAVTYADIGNRASCAGPNRLTLFDGSGAQLGESDFGGFDLCTLFDDTTTGTVTTAMQPGTYYFRVDTQDPGFRAARYLLDVELQ